MNRAFAISGYIVVCLSVALQFYFYVITIFANLFSTDELGYQWKWVEIALYILPVVLVLFPFKVKPASVIIIPPMLLMLPFTIHIFLNVIKESFFLRDSIWTLLLCACYLYSMYFLIRVLLNKNMNYRSPLTASRVVNIVLLVFPLMLIAMIWGEYIVSFFKKS